MERSNAFKSFTRALVSRILRMPESGVIASVVTLTIIFTLIDVNFISFQNISGILVAASLGGIAAIGSAFLLITGEFDLSIGGNYGVSAIIFAILVSETPDFTPLWFFVVLLMGAGVGFVNGIVSTKTKVPSFVATLGMSFFLRGLALFLTQGRAVIAPEVPFLSVLNGKLYDQLRTCVIWFAVVAVLFWFLLNKTRYGNWTYATGGNINVAKAMGVDGERVKIQNFVMGGMCASAAGMIFLARFNEAFSVAGSGIELEAIAAAVIGGTSLYGGFGSGIGAALGAVLFMMIKVGLIIIGAPAFWYRAYIGGILVIASIINMWLFAK
jgi:simple sugar transport system permease protein